MHWIWIQVYGRCILLGLDEMYTSVYCDLGNSDLKMFPNQNTGKLYVQPEKIEPGAAVLRCYSF
jgi:hypothetical protein